MWCSPWWYRDKYQPLSSRSSRSGREADTKLDEDKCKMVKEVISQRCHQEHRKFTGTGGHQEKSQARCSSKKLKMKVLRLTVLFILIQVNVIESRGSARFGWLSLVSFPFYQEPFILQRPPTSAPLHRAGFLCIKKLLSVCNKYCMTIWTAQWKMCWEK